MLDTETEKKAYYSTKKNLRLRFMICSSYENVWKIPEKTNVVEPLEKLVPNLY